MKVVTLSEGISLIKGAGDEGDNPHVWVGISNAILEVENLGRAMEGIDPARRELYEKKYGRLRRKT